METYIREVLVNYGPYKENVIITSPQHVYEFLKSCLIDNSREHFITLYLDASNQIIGYAVVSIGTANASVAHPREIFQRAVLIGACSIIVAHNHPSGNLVFSNEDLQITKRLEDCAEILGMKLLDHIVFSSENYKSLKS